MKLSLAFGRGWVGDTYNPSTSPDPRTLSNLFLLAILNLLFADELSTWTTGVNNTTQD